MSLYYYINWGKRIRAKFGERKSLADESPVHFLARAWEEDLLLLYGDSLDEMRKEKKRPLTPEDKKFAYRECLEYLRENYQCIPRLPNGKADPEALMAIGGIDEILREDPEPPDIEAIEAEEARKAEEKKKAEEFKWPESLWGKVGMTICMVIAAPFVLLYYIVVGLCSITIAGIGSCVGFTLFCMVTVVPLTWGVLWLNDKWDASIAKEKRERELAMTELSHPIVYPDASSIRPWDSEGLSREQRRDTLLSHIALAAAMPKNAGHKHCMEARIVGDTLYLYGQHLDLSNNRDLVTETMADQFEDCGFAEVRGQETEGSRRYWTIWPKPEVTEEDVRAAEEEARRRYIK